MSPLDGKTHSMTELSISRESPNTPEVAELLLASDHYMASLYPAESNHAPDLAELENPQVSFFVARLHGKAVGCAALVRKAGGYAEIKRMYVDNAVRGKGAGKMLIKTLNEEAARLSLACIRLETGIHQPEAIGLYRRDGFTECEPFGEYSPDPLSIFMEKML